MLLYPVLLTGLRLPKQNNILDAQRQATAIEQSDSPKKEIQLDILEISCIATILSYKKSTDYAISKRDFNHQGAKTGHKSVRSPRPVFVPPIQVI
jgi:hypothetical protein